MDQENFSSQDTLTISNQMLAFLVGYRWLSLLPVGVALLVAPERPLLISLLLAILINSLITWRANQLNSLLLRQPALLLLDLFVMLGFVTFSGGWQSPFYLYTLNPVLIAAFQFELKGALLTALASTSFYLTAVFQPANQPTNWIITLTSTAGYFLIGSTFGFATSLFSQLRTAQQKLNQSHNDLALLHKLTVSLRAANSIEEMQEYALQAITTDLNCPKAVIGLVNPETAVLTSWLGRTRSGHITTTATLPHSAEIPITEPGSLMTQALQQKQTCFAGETPCTPDAWLNTYFGMSGCTIIPLHHQEQSVGILLVNTGQTPPPPARLQLLEAIAGQTATAIVARQTRLNRARQLAIQSERLRIAQDIHDSVSQSLFGIVFTLDASLKLLPNHPEQVVPELERALHSAEEVRAEIRHAILDLWPTQLTAARFTADLQKYAADICPNEQPLQLKFDIRGEFGSLSPLARRTLYRMAQEALNNMVYHAEATEGSVCVDVANGRAQLVVRDNGRGFHPDVVLAQPHAHTHFGLQGIQKRAQSLGGECHIFSRPGEGASIIVEIPAAGTP